MSRHSKMNAGAGLPRWLAVVMSIAAGIVVANLYYSQPLLSEMARTFSVSPKEIGGIAMLTQVGYAAGMLLVIPLADVADRRKMILGMAAAAVVALVAVAVAQNFWWLAAASFAVGALSIVPQLLVPFAAFLAKPEERGRAIGSVMSGLLIGILVARTVSGEVGEHLGWREMYWVAAGLMILVAVALWRLLPQIDAPHTATYSELMRSLGMLAKRQPVLRESAFTGAMVFAAFSCFWATLVFRLGTPPYHYGPQAAGLFGLIGVVGAIAAPVAGRGADRRNPRVNLRIAIAIVMVSFWVFWAGEAKIAALVVGVILLDAGVQAAQVTNQARIYSLPAEAHNRLNTVYMVTYFLGGALGTAVAAYAWEHWHWRGVCSAALAFLVAAMAAVCRPVRYPDSREPRA